MIRLDVDNEHTHLYFTSSKRKSKETAHKHEDGEGIFFELSENKDIHAFYKEFGSSAKTFPENVEINLTGWKQEDEYYLTSLFRLYSISKKNNSLRFWTTSSGFDLTHIDYKDYVYYRSMIEEIPKLKLNPKVEYYEAESVEDESSISLFFEFNNESDTIEEIIKNIISPYLNALQNIVEQQINDFKWDMNNEKNEEKFSKNFLYPLFLKMGFDKVIYNHGNKEFGKDFILSRRNEFFEEEYYGVQVKVGNISGKVNSNVDEIIGQAYDSFQIPWKDIRQEEKFINKLIVVTSGKFTDNAKEKIKHKLDTKLKANTLFFDKDSIITLNRKYLKK